MGREKSEGKQYEMCGECEVMSLKFWILKEEVFYFYLLVYVKRKTFFIPTGSKGEFRILVTVLLFPNFSGRDSKHWSIVF